MHTNFSYVVMLASITIDLVIDRQTTKFNLSQISRYTVANICAHENFQTYEHKWYHSSVYGYGTCCRNSNSIG